MLKVVWVVPIYATRGMSIVISRCVVSVTATRWRVVLVVDAKVLGAGAVFQGLHLMGTPRRAHGGETLE